MNWVVIIPLALAACNPDFATDPNHNPDGPGTPQWGDTDVSCSNDDDCNYGEVCVSGVCQMDRCGKEYKSIPPLGERRAFLIDRDIVASDGSASGGYFARGFLNSGSTISASTSWYAGGTRIADVAGGALLPDGPELVAVAHDGDSMISVPQINKSMNAGFVPVAITAGDVDRDGMDEVVAFGASGQVAICDVDVGSCQRWDFAQGATGYEVAAGDVDGDGSDELVFHMDVGDGQRLIVVWNLDADVTGQPPTYAVASQSFIGLAVADVDGDHRAEIFGLEDGGWLGLAFDHIYMYASNGSALAQSGSISVTSGALDITGGDLDRDNRGEVILLAEDKVARVYRGTSLALAYQSTLSGAGAPQRIATVDFDGDSSIGRLIDGPQLIPGEAVLTTVMYMPPYYESISSGRSEVSLGSGTLDGGTSTSSVGLSIGATVGYAGKLPSVLEGEVSFSLNLAAMTSRTFTRYFYVSNNYSVEANPVRYGPDIAAVVLSCGCYHAYTYQLSSPIAGANGNRFVVLVPVGGQTMLWSSKRYNAMAMAVGNMPIVEVPHRVGDARSYPTAPTRADGSPVPPVDLVLGPTPPYRVSDVGTTEWSLNAEDWDTNGVSRTTTLGVEGSVTVAGFTLGGSTSLEWEQGYEVIVGATLALGGSVPPIGDNPSTPEDEYTAYSYGFSPLVYRQFYTTSSGSQAGYYVVNYSVDF